MVPVRLSIVTYNLWNTVRWPDRAPALGQFVELFQPDILCLQELRPETQAFLDQAMPVHDRVHDRFLGWTREGNIYWSREFLEGVEYGIQDVGILEEHRRLFWTRLRVRNTDRTLFVSTAHLTYQGHPQERETGQSPRLAQTRQIVQALDQLVASGEPAFFMGDLNDPVHPMRILHDAGYVSCFASLGIQSPPTHPCYPTAQVAAGARTTNQTIDWIVSNPHARPLAAQVPHCYYEDLAPSDHWPVLAIYQI